ncbi:hypothetical protein [Hymenobacter terricola]|uniref:hypothetical protein n=1 Tax=Hymenobacter terricola TaxID=2819236 RepID=UPI001B30D21B|nr:hypothetical protein [Hymenobacter terricola]
MSAEKLAFLQNFYTDVTLYVPAEPEPVAAAPKAVVPVAAAPAAPEASKTTPKPPVRDVQLPSKSFSQPSAGLERLAAGFHHPITAPEPLVEAPAQPAQAAERPVVAAAPVAAPPAQPADAPAVPPVMLTQFSTLGNNAQGVILLFRLPPEQFVKLHRNVFLNKMLQALGIVMADVVLVNVESDLPVALVNLRRELAATHIIAFGKNLLDTTIRNTQIYEPVQFPGIGLSYLSSATVELVEYDTSLKKRLWPGLQRMFGVG